MRQRLGVNVDHVATLRQARRTMYPDPIEAAIAAERAGADQITVHLREDRRHIQERDVDLLRRIVTSSLNLEMAATEPMVRFARQIAPDIVTLVPERREELTTEGGLDVAGNRRTLSHIVRGLREAGIWVSMFIDPAAEQVEASREIEADAVEIHTGAYAEAHPRDQKHELSRISQSARVASSLGLSVAAGHGLHYRNVGDIARIEEIEELNIGHSIVARALFSGMEGAVREMLALMHEHRPQRR